MKVRFIANKKDYWIIKIFLFSFLYVFIWQLFCPVEIVLGLLILSFFSVLQQAEGRGGLSCEINFYLIDD